MKLSRILATGAAAALVGVSTLAIGGSAVADDFYVQDIEFGAQGTGPGTPYPAAGWFTGNVAPGGSFASTTSGLSFTGEFQILNSTTPRTGVGALVAGAELGVVSGEIAFQIPIWADGDTNTGFTTLVPVDPGNAGLHRADDGWTVTQDVVDGGTTVLDNTAFYTLNEIETALDNLSTTYEILAFGAFLPTTKSAVVSHITWNGDTHWFLPAAPTATVTPSSLTMDEMESAGVSGVFTGFVPNENVVVSFSDGGSGSLLPGPYTADANGTVTIAYDAALSNGTYTLSAFGDSGVTAAATFAVTANPVELAETGADFTPEIVAGSALLLMGGAFVVAARRRVAAKRH